MRIKFHGTRGSYPTSSSENEYYGGRTPCVELIDGDERLILDAGTGILDLDEEYYGKRETINILLTHLHMDHIQGLAFFKPLFHPGKVVNIWGPGGTTHSLFNRLNRYLSPPLFPVMLREIPSDLRIREVTHSSWKIGSFNIYSRFVSHPGPTLGFRIEKEGRTLTYIPDHEPVLCRRDLFDDVKWLSGFDLARGSDLLIHDAQFVDGEYRNKIGWGHCTMYHAAEVAGKSGVKKLIMFHHDPEHSDQFLESAFQDFTSTHDYDFPMELAVQGTEIEV